jgi:hypothetical protein
MDASKTRTTDGPTVPTDRTLPMTRLLSAVIAPVLVLAFAVLVPDPGDVTDLFAWDIQPSMSAMVLGSVYLGGAWFFVRAASGPPWHTVAGGFLPVAAFATLMGVATVLHWERFSHGHVAFWLWVTLYFTTPVLVLAAFLRNRRERPRALAREWEVPPGAAAVLVLGGVAACATAVVLFVFPTAAIKIWPWPLTPLTARTMGAIFVLGSAGLGALWERRWSAMRLLVQVEILMLVLIGIAAVRAGAEFDTGRVLTWLFAIGFSAALVSSVAGYLYVASRRIG